MTSIPAEFYALVNAFLFALHNMFTKKALRYSNPATAVISGLLINIIFLWGLSILFVPVGSLTSASILIFAVVGLFQPGLTRLLSYKGIDALGVAITDPIRATTLLFSAMMAIIFLGEKLPLAIVVATLMIMAGITLLSWQWFDETRRVGGLSVVPDRSVGTSGCYSSRSQGRSSGGSPSAGCGGGDGDFLVYRVYTDPVVRRKESTNLEDEPALLLVVSRRRVNHQCRHGVHLLCAGFRQGFGRDPDRQHRPVLLINLGRDVFARRRARHGKDRSQRRHDRGRGGAAYALEVIRAKDFPCRIWIFCSF
jgi:uncharacterized membrane protein